MVNARWFGALAIALQACGGSPAPRDTSPQPEAAPAESPPAEAPAFELAQQPPPRPEHCTRWHGTVTGNDPTVAITATLCQSGTAVHGELEWFSRNSGRSVRAIEGRWSMGQLVLRDVEMHGTPRPGWQFCLIDRYALSAAGDRLAGTYRSSVCRDDATISLIRER